MPKYSIEDYFNTIKDTNDLISHLDIVISLKKNSPKSIKYVSDLEEYLREIVGNKYCVQNKNDFAHIQDLKKYDIVLDTYLEPYKMQYLDYFVNYFEKEFSEKYCKISAEIIPIDSTVYIGISFEN